MITIIAPTSLTNETTTITDATPIAHGCVLIFGHSNHLKLSGSRHQDLEVAHSPALTELGLVEKD